MMEKKAYLSPSIQSFGGAEEGLSIQGASHVKHGKICQDFGGHFRCDNYAIAVVCDGHGGDAYIRSDRGSKFGVQATIDAIKAFMANKHEFLYNLFDSDNKIVQDKKSSKALNQLIKSIISHWNIAVGSDLEQNPFTEDELAELSEKYKTRYASDDENKKYPAYGSTLMAVVYTSKFWFGIRIGDGKCVALSRDGAIYDPIPPDEKCFLNRTTSLCDDKAFDNFRHCFFTDNFPVAIFVATDGVDDSFGADERLFNFYKRLTQSFAYTGFEGGKQELKDYLPKLTSQGSGDDISISGIVDMDAIKELFVEKTNAQTQEAPEEPKPVVENDETQMQSEEPEPVVENEETLMQAEEPEPIVIASTEAIQTQTEEPETN